MILRSKRGFALLAVLGVLAMLVILLVTAQVSVESTRDQTQAALKRLLRDQGERDVLIHLSQSGDVSAQVRMLEVPGGARAEVTTEPLPDNHPFWRGMKALKPLPGDLLVTIRWEGAETAARTSRHLLNVRKKRPDAISLNLTANADISAPASPQPEGMGD